MSEISLPAEVTSIGTAVFSKCTNLKKIEMKSDSNPYYQTIDGVLYNREGTTLIAYPNQKGNTYTIPESVTDIEEFAFEGCSNLRKINLPKGLTRIDYAIFHNCSNLQEVILPEGITFIDYLAFAGCSSLKKIDVPKSVYYIRDDAFEESPNVVIYGFAGSYAETYAKKHDIPFVEKKEISSDSGIQLVYTEDAISETVTLHAVPLSTGDNNYDKINIESLLADKTISPSEVKYQPYEITLVDESDQPVQPKAAVTVKIPCPEGYDGANCKVYYMAEDGILKDMQAVYSGGYLAFETTHFSTYLVTDTELEATLEGDILYGDANGDGKVDTKDAVLLKKYLAGYEDLTINLDAADVTGDGSVNSKDAVRLLRYLAGYKVELGE